MVVGAGDEQFGGGAEEGVVAFEGEFLGCREGDWINDGIWVEVAYTYLLRQMLAVLECDQMDLYAERSPYSKQAY